MTHVIMSNLSITISIFLDYTSDSYRIPGKQLYHTNYTLNLNHSLQGKSMKISFCKVIYQTYNFLENDFPVIIVILLLLLQ